MLRGLGKFIRGEPVRRGLFLSAWAQLGRARWDLRRRPVKEVLGGFTEPDSVPDTTRPTAEQKKLAHEIGLAIRAAASRTPWDSSCLVQVLAAQRMLRARGVGGAIFLGADIAPSGNESEFYAHAWLICGETFVTGETGYEQYTVLGGVCW